MRLGLRGIVLKLNYSTYKFCTLGLPACTWTTAEELSSAAIYKCEINVSELESLNCENYLYFRTRFKVRAKFLMEAGDKMVKHPSKLSPGS
jgi:hypothetical protein